MHGEVREREKVGFGQFHLCTPPHVPQATSNSQENKIKVTLGTKVQIQAPQVLVLFPIRVWEI